MRRPALIAGYRQATLLTADGEFLTVPGVAVAGALSGAVPLVLHGPATFRRLGVPAFPVLDLLELFAFVMPARTVAPTPGAVARVLGLAVPASAEAAAAALPEMAQALLARLAAGRELPLNREAAGLAARMARDGWGWAGGVLAALGTTEGSRGNRGFQPWLVLPEWQEAAPAPPPASWPVAPQEARRRLASLLGPEAEQRPGQADYADAAAGAFRPRPAPGDPALVLAEAGTGTGKTLGYLAPASLWAERNGAPVWISTYTRHLQRQVEAEVARLHPEPNERRQRVVIRKGRENYLCLLNLEDQVRTALGGFGGGTIALGLACRWALATADGDLAGGDLPGWFGELFGTGSVAALADRRGECIHGACAHYTRCFVEHTIRRARTADLVIANHALVMAQASWGGLDDASVPLRYVFDEGHLLFEAADSAFSAEFSGAEGAELRRWLLGAEGGRSRARGLRRRLEELVLGSEDLSALLEAVASAARALPAAGWSARLAEGTAPELGGVATGRPNPSEAFLAAARAQVLARCAEAERPGARASLECDLHPVEPALAEAAETLRRALGRLAEPLRRLAERLEARLDEEAETLAEADRLRIEAAVRGLRRRALEPLSAWQGMLRDVGEVPPTGTPATIDFLRLNRGEAGDRDAALLRHALDPTIPFARVLGAQAHGMLITSATLRDAGAGDAEAAWHAAEARVGAHHLPSPALRATVASPFDYAAQTRAFVVSDVAPEIESLAAAYRALFLAAGGGALGLFTAISRLQAVHARLAPALEAAGIPLLAQHVDAMDNASLVEVFRAEETSCLLGTDAMRDGVDVPGRALRLVVFERVPWPRPDILHRERRLHLSGGDTTGYDHRAARLRLRQAFGRLIRSTGDHGVFVLLDRRTPTRLLDAFPPGVSVRRVGLAEAVAETRAFLGTPPGAAWARARMTAEEG